MRYIDVNIGSYPHCDKDCHQFTFQDLSETSYRPIAEGCYNHTFDHSSILVPETHPCFNINIVIWDISDIGYSNRHWGNSVDKCFRQLKHLHV